MLSCNKIYVNGKSVKIPVQIYCEIWGSSCWRTKSSTTVILYLFFQHSEHEFLLHWQKEYFWQYVGQFSGLIETLGTLAVLTDNVNDLAWRGVRPWIGLKCRPGTQTRRFFRKCVLVPCGASVQMKKSPRRCLNPGLWTFGPARCPLGYLGTDYNGSDCFPTRWLLSGPDSIFLHAHWRSHVQEAGWWSCGRLRTLCPDLRVRKWGLMIFSYFLNYAVRVHWWMCGVLSPFS